MRWTGYAALMNREGMSIGDRKGNAMKQYIVDAFTDKPFSGNPAAVCVMESWPSEESMMKLAMENNLSETAFIVKEDGGYHLRWFTPGTEADCVSRSFCPKLAVAEDPVCGSAHCQIADYWSGELNKKQLLAYQASKRGGYLYCELREDGRINISGKAALVGIADIVAEL